MKIIKRDGRIVDFDRQKIMVANKKANEEVRGRQKASKEDIKGIVNYIEEIIAWVIFSADKNNEGIRGSIRSRGPIINTVAAKFNGGGHVYASGVRLKTSEEVDHLIAELDKTCLEYKEKQ